MQVLNLLGRFQEIAGLLPTLLDEAWQRSDLVSIPTFVSFPMLALVALGEHGDAEREHARAAAAWSALENPYGGGDLSLHLGRVWLLHSRRSIRAAWQACLAHDVGFRRSAIARCGFTSALWQFIRGTTAAALAAETRDARERTRLLEEAENAPGLARRTSRWRGWLLLPHVAAACARRDRDRAVNLLQNIGSARPAFWGQLFLHATRRHLGVLLGGDEGKALVTEADVFFRAGGAVDTERFAATLIPGCEIR